MAIKILLADDHAIIRHGLSKSIQEQEDMEIVGQSQDGLSTIAMVRELLPDVVIMDISMPDINGIDATREIVRDFPNTKVIALSMHSAKKYISEMFKAGACSYLMKDCDFDELTKAIRTVIAGKNYLSPQIADIVVDSYVKTTPDSTGTSVFSELTKRERQVLQFMSEGKTTKQIGLRLHISPKTVEAHRLRVMEKLSIDNVAQLTKYAIQEGLTTVEI